MFMLSALSVLGTQASEADRAVRQVKPERVVASVKVKVKLDDAEELTRKMTVRDNLEDARQKTMQLSRDNESLKRENQLLKRELIEILNNQKTRDESYRRLQLGIAATLASGKLSVAGNREGQLIKALSDLAADGKKLALKTIEFCESVRSLVRDMPMAKIRQLQFKLVLDDLESKARRFSNLAALDNEQPPAERCRILAVNPELQVVILPVGSIHGVFNGLNYFSGKGQTKLTVISVRPFVAAAIVTAGNIDELTSGMEIVTDVKKINPKQ